MSTPLISVIMSAYNSEKTVGEAIESILNQSYSNFEFLITNDCSTDNTLQIIHSYQDSRIKVYENEINSHLVKTWNKMATYTKGEFITFQDADDISYPNRLENLLSKIKQDNELAVVGANFYRPFPKWKTGLYSNFSLSHSEIIEQIENHKSIHFFGTRALFRKSMFDEVGGFREYFDRVGCEDYDLFLRLAQKYKVANISDIVYEYRYYPTSSSKLSPNRLNVKRIFIYEICLFLYEQRKQNNGVDALINELKHKELDKYLETLNIPLITHKSIPFLRIAKNQCANKDFRNSYKNILKAIRIEPFFKDNWFFFIFLQKAFLKTLIKYSYLKITNK